MPDVKYLRFRCAASLSVALSFRVYSRARLVRSVIFISQSRDNILCGSGCSAAKATMCGPGPTSQLVEPAKQPPEAGQCSNVLTCHVELHRCNANNGWLCSCPECLTAVRLHARLTVDEVEHRLQSKRNSAISIIFFIFLSYLYRFYITMLIVNQS